MRRSRSSVLLGLIVLALLSCQAVANLPNPFATATPTPTLTFTPSPTSTPSPTPTFTPTPTSTPTALPTGTAKQLQSDGTMRFVDYDNGYQMDFASNWVVTNLRQSDIDSILNKAAKDNPELAQALQSMRYQNQQTFRAFAFDVAPGDAYNGSAPNINVTVQNDPMVNDMSLQQMLDATAQILPQIAKGERVTSSKLSQTASGIPISILETQLSGVSVTGSRVTLYQQLIVFKLHVGFLAITLTAPNTLKQNILPSFQQIIDSVKISGT